MSRHGRAARVLLLGAGLTAAAGCRREQRPQPTATRASASARPSSSPRAAAVPKPPPTVHGCRVLGVKGQAAPAGTPAVGTLLHTKEWLDLAQGVELQLKHSETTRELSLIGPGRFLACADGAEAVLVARGVVATTPGPGSRAGAEVELGTPFAVVRYADAALRLEVSEGGLTLEVKQGAAGVAATEKAESAAGPDPEPVRGPKGKLALTGKVDGAALAARCTAARQAIAAKTAGPAPSAGPERGAWAVGLFKARQAARLTCSRARAAAGRLEAAERVRLDDQLESSMRLPNAETDAGK